MRLRAGTVTTPLLPNDTYATRQYLIRINPDGSLDATFGDGGVVITKFPGFAAAEAWAVALQGNGKIVVSGIGGTIARYEADGSLDTSFGHGGLLRTTRDGAGRDVAVQSDGKVIVTTESGAVRYNADGSVDRTLIAPGNPGTRAVAISPDGSIVIVGQFEQLGRGAASDFFVARFKPNALEIDNSTSGGFAGNDSLFARRDRIRLLDDPDAGNDDGLLDFGSGGKDDKDHLELPEIL